MVLVNWPKLGIQTLSNSMAGQACNAASASITQFIPSTQSGSVELVPEVPLQEWAKQYAKEKQLEGKQSLINACLKIKEVIDLAINQKADIPILERLVGITDTSDSSFAEGGVAF